MDQLGLNLVGGALGAVVMAASTVVILLASRLGRGQKRAPHGGRREWNRGPFSRSTITFAGAATLIGGMLMLTIAIFGGFG